MGRNLSAGQLLYFGAAAALAAWALSSAHRGSTLRRVTAEAYARAAEVDLKLARRAAAAGDMSAVEGRVNRAEDKLESDRAVGAETAAARAGLGELQGRYAPQLKSVRRKRAMDRFDREGAETR